MKTPLRFRITVRLIGIFAALFLAANLTLGQVQINEGFESLIFPSTGWVESGSGDWSKQSAAAGYPVHSGSFTAYCNGAGSYLVTPAITVNPADILTFWYRVESNSVPQDMDVLISSNPLLFTDTLFSLNGANNIVYTKANISLAAYTGQTVYIAFVGQTGGGAIFDYGILLDDILLFGLPECALPLSPANGATNVAVSAGMSWGNASAADGYVLNFGTNYPPDNIENGTDLGTATSYTPAGLNYSTTYYWQVVPYNVNGSPSCGIWSFTTGADPVIHAFPWTEPFSSWPPAGWGLSGGSLSWAPYGSTAAYCNFWNWPTGNAVMTTPALDLSQDATLKFAWSHAYLPGFNDQFEVQISESGSGTWTTLWSISGAAFHSNDGATNIAPGSYTQESVLIPVSFTGKTVNIRFVGTSGNGNDLFLDQVSVEFDPFLTVSVDDIFVCYGTAGTLDAIARGGQKPYQFSWTPVAGLADPTAASTSVNTNTTALYTVVVTDALGSTATASATVSVNPMLSVTANYNTTVCTNNLTQLNAQASGGTPPYTYAWDNGATLSNPAIADPFSFANTTTTYSVTVTDAEGCQAFGQVTVTTTSQASATIFPVDPEICAGESVVLTATGGVTYSWTSIPAGFTSSSATVNVSPASTRQYVVQTGSSCGNKRDTITVTVHPLPVVSFGAVAPVCVDGNPVALTSGAPAGGVYAGPGVSGGVFDPAIAGAGNHVLSYTYTDINGCINTATTVVTVNALPVVAFTGLNTDYCVSAAPSALFGLPAGGTFNGPGILPGDLFNPAAAGVGTHVIMYAYTDANGCTNVTTKGVTVHALPVLSISGLNSSYCLTDAIAIIYGSEAPFGSFSGPGITDLGNGTARFNPVMAWIGTHTVTYTYTDINGCSNAVSQSVSVFPLPNVSFSGLALSYCGNEAPVTLTGNQAPFGTFTGHGITDLGNGTATFNPAVAVTFPAFLNRHEIKYSYTSPDGCTNVASIFVTVHYVPTVNAGADQTICLGNVAQLNAIPGGGTPPYSYAWDNAASLSNALIRNPIASPLVTTTYTVTITDFNGCQNSDNLTITVNDPVATVVDDTTCLNTPIALNVIPSGGSAPYTYIWSPAASLNNPFVQNPIATPLTIGNHVYTVTITDAIGCFGTASMTLTVLPIPVAFNVTGGGDYCAGGSGVPVGLDGSETGISYELYLDGVATGNVVNGTGSAISFGNILVAGTYTVLATHPNGCTLDMTGSAMVIVNPLPTSSVLTGDTCICNGTPANLFVAIAGGLSPYTLTIFDGTSNFIVNAYVSGTPIVVNPLVTTTYTLVDVVDANGCTSQGISGAATVSIDLTAPTFTVPADITLYTDASCSYSLAVSVTGDVTDEADNCTPVLDATYSDVSVAGCEGTEVVTRTWTLVDNCGNTLVQTQVITVLDTTPPTFTVPADITLYTDANCSYSLAVSVTGDVTDEDDNCTSVLDATFTDVSVAGCEGTEVVTRTWTLVDDCGNSLIQTQVITVLDTTPPTFTVPADITIYTDANCAYDATVAATGDVTDEDDNCTTVLDATFADVIVPGSCTGTYTITRTWTLVDDCGNSLVQTQVITVLDTTPPTFTVPADITLYTDANCSYSLAVSVTGDVTDEADNCTTVLDATFSDVSVPGCEGTEVVTRTWTLVDDCGNSLVQTQVITVLDTTPPTFTVPADITLYTDANCSYSLAVSVTGDVTDEDDNCTTVLDATFTDVSVPGCEGTEVVTRTWTLVDDCGNSLVQTQVITVLDTTPPTFTVPADITIYSDANCVYDATVAATGDVTDEDDNCTTVLDATFSDVTVPGSCSGNWTITRTWTLVDNCGNSLVQTQVITVLDTTPPTFTVPANITLYTDAGCTYSTATSITGDVTDEADNCTALLNATFSDVTVPGACLGSYVVTRTWTLSDDCSNTTVKQQIITVLDTLDPIFVSCPANVTINCVNADTSTANLGFPVVTDNCSPLPDIDITYTDVILSYTCPGDYSFARTFTAVDDCGNSSSCTQIVTVIDTIVIACPADMVVCADDPAFALIGATPLGGTYSGTGVSGNVFDPALAGPGVHTITYTYTVDFCCVHTCTFSITVNPNPAAFNVTGGGAFCSGAIGVVVFLDGSEIGILYQLYNNGVATGPLVGGTGAQITFGYQNVAGNYTVIATNPVTGCTKLMTGSAAVVVHPLPVAFNVTGGGSYCAGGAGLDVGLDGSELGVNYELYLYGASTGQVVAGNGGLITFGPQTLAGNYTVHAVNASTLCESWMNGSVSITINPNPVVFNVTGGGNYCTGGPGVNVGLSYSELGISYELIHNGSNTGIVLTGTGSALDFGPQSTAGTYTIFATNTVTLCSALMNGSANVTINPLPLPYAVTGGGSYCSGGAGVVVGLANSQTGTNYELYLDGLSTGDTLLGTGSALSFGPQTATGTYTIVATIISTGCTNNMLGSVTVTLYPAPIVYNVTGGGSYCAGGAGVVVGLDGSEVGVDYELWLNGVATSVIISGTGSPVSFPAQTAAGTYTVQGIGVATACVNLMNGNAVISIDPLPVVFTVTGGGSYCAGGTGVPVGLSGSEAGLTYALHLNGVATGQIVGGTGAAISFGDQTAAGIYTIEGTNAATGCVNLMGGNAVVVIDPLPIAYTVTGGGVICAGAVGMNVGLSGSSVGILYELQLDGVNTGTVLGGTGSALNFGPQTVAGIYSILATNPITGCTNPMTGSVTVVVNPLPLAFTVTGGGAYCIGGTVPEVGLSGSETGITYELYRDGIGTGQLQGGTGLAITFGIQSTTGTYTVIATNTTTNCTEMMTGSVAVTMNTLPVAFAITGGGPYCQNSGGIGIGLAGSEIGVNYELYLNGNPTFNILAGTGTPLDFGLQIIAGTYTVMATNATTGCQSLMTGSTVVSIFINPIATAMSNSPVCEGDMIELFGGGAGCELVANTCNASSTSWFQEHITNVTLNGAVNPSTGSTYSDFTGNLLSTLFIGNTYSLSVTNFVDGSFDQYVSVFIDWNRDGDFSDAGEAMPIGNFVGTHTFNYSLSVPVGAEVGYTMMRVINQWSSAPLACGTFTYGEVEDYKIEVKSSVGPTCQYSWSGPAGFSSALQYPTITPATSSNAGLYTVTVTDANGCTASATTTVVVNPLPAVSFSGLLPVYCSDDAPALLTGSPAGGTFSGQGISGSTFYPGIAGTGNWDIVYSYTNSFGCENSDTMNVTVNPSPVATTSADTTICQGGTAVVFAGGGSTYLWSTGSTNSAIFVSPLITTTYDVTVTNSFGCTDNASVTVNVNPVPLVNAGGDLEVCLGESIQLDVTATGAGPVYGYQWTPAVGLTDPTLKNPMASPTATTTYVVLVTSGLGCTASDDVVVTVNPLPNADAGQDMTLCFGTTTTLTATPAGMSYLWSTGQTSQSIVVVFGDTATYFVTVTNSFGCSAVDSVTLSSFPLPSAIVSPTQTICEFELAYISATGAGVGGTYSWSSVPAGFTATGPNHIVQPADSTIYYVTVTDLNGCTNMGNTVVNVNPKPVVYAGPDVSVCENHTVTLDAGIGYDNYLWSNGVPQQVITIDSTGVGIGSIIYTVTVTLDGCAAMDDVVVEFLPCPGLDELNADNIAINVFPNPNDGRFTVSVKGFEGSVDLLILNNIGQTVVNERLGHNGSSMFSRDYDLSSFPPGMYFLRFSDGDIVRTKKVIIQ